ncbi:MAG: hypothetical protein FD143_1157 [Ignavibacteria bacterium]|nr:MAG: hypothetical protein FD143_1157 [Ignavibacteria bacterium]KAF0160869.1 MAG: hypothetical protein FD188_1368 [Ignavibacteria bacterium]
MFSSGTSSGKSQPVLRIKFGNAFIELRRMFTSSITFSGTPFRIEPTGFRLPINTTSLGINFAICGKLIHASLESRLRASTPASHILFTR